MILLEGTENVQVKPITKEELPQVKDWILNHHYIKRWPTGVGPQGRLGVYVDGKLSGCLLYGPTLHPIAGSKLFQKDEKPMIQNNQCMELLRAFTTEEAKKKVPNLGSIVISKGNEVIRTTAKTKQGNPIRAILSYADPTAGHSGSVYKATNAVYLGPQKEGHVLILTHPDGQKLEIHQMSLQKYKTHSIDKLKDMPPFKGNNLKWETRQGKHKYLYVLGKDQKEKDELLAHLTVSPMSYPEPGKISVPIENPAKERYNHVVSRQKTQNQQSGQTSKKDIIKNILKSKVYNPETENKILVSSALSYPHDHPSYKQAMGMIHALSKKHNIRIKSTR